MAACIYCGAPADSREHWLPRLFGVIKGVTTLQDRVCNPCNNELGQLDEEIAKTGPTGFQKSLLQIEGRHGKPINPFLYKVMGKESATTMTMPSPLGDYNILGDPYIGEDGERHVRPLRQLVFDKNGEMVCVPFPPAYDSALLDTLLKERGVENATLKIIYLSPTEGPEHFNDVRRVLADTIGRFGANVYYGQGPTSGPKSVDLKAGISQRYLRGLAKIGFHYYLVMSSIHTGSELLFQPVRHFIRYGEGDWHSFVQLTIPQFIGELAAGYVPENVSHFFASNHVSVELRVAVQFFVGPEHMTPPSLIRLGWTSRQVGSTCHWVSYYGEKLDGYDGEITEVSCRT